MHNVLLSFMLVLIPATMTYVLTPFYIRMQEEKKDVFLKKVNCGKCLSGTRMKSLTLLHCHKL